MKLKTYIAMAMILVLGSCKTVVITQSKPGPGKSNSAPGQVKKTTGSTSAKPYAPGQQKKKGN
jgi:hypothetical protein